MANSKELQIWKAWEHFVCYDLIMRWFNAFLSDQWCNYDVLVEIKWKIKRIQVRTRSKTSSYLKWKDVYRVSFRRWRWSKKTINSSEFDFLAVVLLDIKQIAYIPVKEITTKDKKLIQCVDLKVRWNSKYTIEKLNKIW